MTPDLPPKTTLAAGGLAGLLASACCLGPLVLVSLGLGGAWMSHLTALAPWSPLFTAIAVLCLLLAYRRIFRPEPTCAPGELCAMPAIRRGYRLAFWAVVALVGLAGSFPWLAPVFY